MIVEGTEAGIVEGVKGAASSYLMTKANHSKSSSVGIVLNGRNPYTKKLKRLILQNCDMICFY